MIFFYFSLRFYSLYRVDGIRVAGGGVSADVVVESGAARRERDAGVSQFQSVIVITAAIARISDALPSTSLCAHQVTSVRWKMETAEGER